MISTTRRWFDAHLDLASLAAHSRDMTAPLRPDMEPHPPASVTLPSLAEGGVTACLATIFTESFDPSDQPRLSATGYQAGDAEGAHRAGLGQLECYHMWREAGLVELMQPPRDGDRSRSPAKTKADALHLGILIESADPIRQPDELSWWADRGVVAVGMAWWKPTRYAGGNGTDLGLTDLGKALAREMDALGVVHDLSHLSQRATDQLLEHTDKPVIASHSNSRALIAGNNQRHLADETIREIGRRGGVIGLNLCSPFLLPSGQDGVRATIEDCVRHVEHVCELQNSRAGIGLGTDMDGGFSARGLPQGIDRPADLHRLADALADRNWPARDVESFMWGNWARFWGV